MKKNSFIGGAFIATLGIIIVKVIGLLYVIPFNMIIGEQGGALYGYAYNILEGWNNNCLTLINADNIVFNEIAGNNGMYFIFENLVEKLNVIINLELQEFADLINNQRARLVKYDINIIVDEYKKMFNKLLT